MIRAVLRRLRRALPPRVVSAWLRDADDLQRRLAAIDRAQRLNEARWDAIIAESKASTARLESIAERLRRGDDLDATAVWAYFESLPGFNAELRRARRDLRAGKGTPFHRRCPTCDGDHHPIDCDHGGAA